MRPPLENLTAVEVVNANYEALKLVFAGTIAALTTTDPLALRRTVDRIIEEIDDQRHDFIVAMREAGHWVEGEVVDGPPMEPGLVNPGAG